MAIYHFSMSNVSRTKGSNACASLAYVTGEKIYDDRTGKSFSYSRRERVVSTGTLLPDGAPPEYKDPAQLFNAIEQHEKAENARTAKKLKIALPRELTLAQQKKLVEGYIRKNFCGCDYAATYAIHCDPDGRNPHVHVLVPNRQIEKNGMWKKCKQKMEYVLDENGERIPRLDKNGKQKRDSRGRKQWKRRSVSVEQNPLDRVDFLRQLRASWADHANRVLREAGHDVRIDHRSNRVRGLAALPTIHEGAAAREMEKRGEISDRCEENRKIKAYNAYVKERTSLLLRIAALDAALKQEQQRPQIASPVLARGQEQQPPMQPATRGSVPSTASRRAQAQEQTRQQTPVPVTDEQRKRQKKFLRYCVARELLARTGKGAKISSEARRAVLARYGEAMAALGMDPKKNARSRRDRTDHAPEWRMV